MPLRFETRFVGALESEQVCVGVDLLDGSVSPEDLASKRIVDFEQTLGDAEMHRSTDGSYTSEAVHVGTYTILAPLMPENKRTAVDPATARFGSFRFATQVIQLRRGADVEFEITIPPR